MPQLVLTPSHRRRINADLRNDAHPRARQRAETVLAISEGKPVAGLAQQCGVSRQSIYNWIRFYTRRRDPHAARRGRKRGRPTVWTPEMIELVRHALAQSPREVGLDANCWRTVEVQHYLARAAGRTLNRHTVRQGIGKAGFVWRRTQFVPTPRRKAALRAVATSATSAAPKLPR